MWVNGQRHVAHAPASHRPDMDCKQAFLTEINNSPTHNLIGWFRPFDPTLEEKQAALKNMYFDEQVRIRGTHRLKRVGPGFISTLNKTCKEYTVMGIVDTNNRCYSIQGFQPIGYPNYFLITGMEKHRLRHGHVFDKAPTVF